MEQISAAKEDLNAAGINKAGITGRENFRHKVFDSKIDQTKNRKKTRTMF